MRVFAVAHDLAAFAAEGDAGRKGLIQFSRKPARDGGIIGAGPRKGAGRQLAPEFRRRRTLACFHFGDQLGVIGGVDDDGDESVVLGRGADQGRAADVDVFDAIVETGARLNRRLEGIQIDHQQIDGADGVFLHRLLVPGVVAPGQQPAMDLRVQGLDPAVHDLGEPGFV